MKGVFRMLDGGYIKIYRRITKWEWYRDANTFRVFMHLLITANYEPHRFEGRLIERGQAVTSQSALSRELGISIQSVRTALMHLKSTGEITVQATAKFSIVTIKSYDCYQQATQEATGDQQASNRLLTGDQQQWKKEKERKRRKRRGRSDPQPREMGRSYDIDELEAFNPLDDVRL